jgi:hypothetical protein
VRRPPDRRLRDGGRKKTRDKYPRIANFPIKVEDKPQDFSENLL